MAVVITAIEEKMKLAKLRFDLPYGYRNNTRVSIRMLLQRIAKGQEDFPPASIAVDVVLRRIGKSRGYRDLKSSIVISGSDSGIVFIIFISVNVTWSVRPF